ncbi:UNVERIFIED_CONTAM: hypothetical protein GTU68_056142 [Idotea baltica]|nr:hypothetical protein [Idotea baltica]
MACGFDVSDSDAVTAGVKEIISAYGKVDILVNNAGIRTIDINLSGCFYLAKAVAKSMMKSRYGRIVNVSSVVGEMGNPGQVAYAASKSGIFGLTKALAKELGGRNITVNAITPGFIETDMTSELSEEQVEAIVGSVALGRFGSVSDISKTVAFLASPDAGYITGQVLGINGGMYM